MRGREIAHPGLTEEASVTGYNHGWAHAAYAAAHGRATRSTPDVPARFAAVAPAYTAAYAEGITDYHNDDDRDDE